MSKLHPMFAFGLCLALLGCSSSTQPESAASAPPSEEAQTLALYLTGDLYPPAELSAQLDNELAAIRTRFRDQFPMLESIHFQLQVANELILRFDPETAASIQAGEYHGWDDLNKRYPADVVLSYGFERFRTLSLRFRALLNPRRLVGTYRSLPGLEHAGTNGQFNFVSHLYPRATDRGMTYLFQSGWGDCPAGCIFNEYWYFTVEDGEVEFVFHARPENPTPERWNEARRNIEEYEAFYDQPQRTDSPRFVTLGD
ncbi:MAG: hypothetical protein R3E12_16225 [Candidatus Eisenbacteria bacterium]|uniref:Lipoprotein n=1 Tax=Eiseniibacteriota bacterium TaxID=2212470 RepID=A0A956LZI7_UNCEI|nr:hypothetical protein [Candidatus Eisenbacteria bacterium]